MSVRKFKWGRHQNKSSAFVRGLVLLTILISFHIYAENALSKLSKEEELIMHRNQGAAHFENEDYDLAALEFEKSVEISKTYAPDLVNLGLAYYKGRVYEKAVPVLEKAWLLAPKYLQSAYTMGLIYKKLNMPEKGIKYFEEVIASDPADPTTYYNLGVLHMKLGQDKRAVQAFRSAIRHNPDHPSAHYYLFSYAKKEGRLDEAKRELKVFSMLQKSIPDKKRTEEAFEEGRYLQPITPSRQSFISAGQGIRNSISFHDITETANLPSLLPFPAGELKYRIPAKLFNQAYASGKLLPHIGGAAYLADLNGDGHTDIYLVKAADTPDRSENRLFLNNGKGKFTDATAGSRTGDKGLGTGVAFGDFDNDGAVDIYVLNFGANRLYRNAGDGTFMDITEAAGVGETGFGKDAAFFDYDHDGDLDLYVGNYIETAFKPARDSLHFPSDFPGQKNVLYRNNGNSTFTVIADASVIKGNASMTSSVSFGDLDNDEDTDLLLVNGDNPSSVYRNLRMGKFGPAEPLETMRGYQGDMYDLDNDGYLDVILINNDGAFLFKNDGIASFKKKELPAISSFVKGKITTALEFLDFDNDGLMDLLLSIEGGRLALFANEGSGFFSLFSSDLAPRAGRGAFIVSLDSADIDSDGDLDILGAWSGGAPLLLENRGGESANWLEVAPVGIRVPRQAIGAVLEIKTGPYYQRRDVTSWPVHFGLGEVDRVEVLRVTWTNGVVQNMLSVPVRRKYLVEEIVRTDASCPFLFVFDGERFNFVNDILGVAAMGVPLGDGIYHMPDPDEYVKIKGELLAESDGLYILGLAEELKEVVYLDQVKLIVVDHPADVEVYPNERFSEPPFIKPGIHTVMKKHYPAKAVDDRGKDILPLIMAEDIKYPSGFSMTAYDGLAEHHWIELDLGDLKDANKVMLYLTGWIYWSSASVNVAVSQNDQVAFEAVSLSVPDGKGGWVTVIDDIGLPNGKNSTMPVDLSGIFQGSDYRLRIGTNMLVYWDEIFFSVDEGTVEVVQKEADLFSSDLHYRGFSTMSRDSLGMESYDYAHTERFGPWRQHAGRYTRYGDVTDLLKEVDDRYVIYGAGEEISLAFSAAGLPGLPAGWTRDFFFYAYGWIKDGDPNTVFSETVAPFPFRGMPGYPYEKSVGDPAEEIAKALAGYLTRGAVDTVGILRK